MFEKAFKNKYKIYVPDGKHEVATLSMKISIPDTLLEDVFHAGDSVKLGVNLDIFAIDNVPDNDVKAKIKGICILLSESQYCNERIIFWK